MSPRFYANARDDTSVAITSPLPPLSTSGSLNSLSSAPTEWSMDLLTRRVTAASSRHGSLSEQRQTMSTPPTVDSSASCLPATPSQRMDILSMCVTEVESNGKPRSEPLPSLPTLSISLPSIAVLLQPTQPTPSVPQRPSDYISSTLPQPFQSSVSHYNYAAQPQPLTAGDTSAVFRSRGSPSARSPSPSIRGYHSVGTPVYHHRAQQAISTVRRSPAVPFHKPVPAGMMGPTTAAQRAPVYDPTTAVHAVSEGLRHPSTDVAQPPVQDTVRNSVENNLVHTPEPGLAIPSRVPATDKYTFPAPKLRENLPKQTTTDLLKWLLEHAQNPYPTEREKRILCHRHNLTITQVNNWFINARRRVLRRMATQGLLDDLLGDDKIVNWQRRGRRRRRPLPLGSDSNAGQARYSDFHLQWSSANSSPTLGEESETRRDSVAMDATMMGSEQVATRVLTSLGHVEQPTLSLHQQ